MNVFFDSLVGVKKRLVLPRNYHKRAMVATGFARPEKWRDSPITVVHIFFWLVGVKKRLVPRVSYD